MTPSASAASAADPVLAGLIDEYNRAAAGRRRAVDAEAFLAAHPEHAGALRGTLARAGDAR